MLLRCVVFGLDSNCCSSHCADWYDCTWCLYVAESVFTGNCPRLMFPQFISVITYASSTAVSCANLMLPPTLQSLSLCALVCSDFNSRVEYEVRLHCTSFGTGCSPPPPRCKRLLDFDILSDCTRDVCSSLSEVPCSSQRFQSALDLPSDFNVDSRWKLFWRLLT